MDINSSTVPYVTVADLIIRKDVNQICQYMSDMNPALPPSQQTPLQPSDLPTYAPLLEIINSACGELEAACLHAEIYQVADLQALASMNPPSASTSFMKKIICNIAMFNIMTRRGGPDPSEVIKNDYDWSMKQLESLTNGERIFGFVQTEQAGLPALYSMTPMDQVNNRFIPAIWPRMFGQRTNMGRPFGSW